MRGRMNAGPSYAPPVEVGKVMEGSAVCEVIESNVSEFAPGDIVFATTGWQEFSLSNGKGVRKFDPGAGADLLRPGCARHAGLYRLYRAAQHRETKGG